MKALVLILLTFFAASHADAAIYYVSPSGLDSHTCTQAQSTATPKRTIANAKGCVRAGDTIQMRGGIYNESQVIWANGPSGTSWFAPITLENYPGEQPVWNMPSDTQIQLYFWNVAYIIVRGITFDGTNGSNSLMPDQTSTPVGGGYNFIIIDCSQSASSGCAHHLRIENNEMRNTAYGAITVAMGANNVEIRNNYMHHNGKISNSNVIYIAGHSNLVENNLIEYASGSIAAWSNNCCGYTDNNVFRGNKVTRIGWFWASDNGTDNLGSHTQNTPNPRSPAFFVSRGTNIQVYNNIIIDSAGGVAVRYNASNCKIHNNTIYGNTNTSSYGYGGIQFEDNTSNCVASNNIIWNQGSNPAIQNNVTGGGGHTAYNNLTTNPGFVNAPMDLRPQASSPAVDSGVNLSPLFDTDFVGVLRPHGSGWDIGAYEHTAGEAPSMTPSPGAMAFLSVSPTTAHVEDTVITTWSGINNPTPTDWIGLYKTGAPDLPHQTNLLAWFYVSCSKTAETARDSGSCPFVLASNLTSGTYELRLFANDDYVVKLATTEFTIPVSTPNVAAPTAPGSLTVRY